MLRSLELCAGAGGQALGLEQAGFRHVALIELDSFACDTLRRNRSGWNIIQGDLRALDGAVFRDVDLLAAGIPCPPFSVAGRQLGPDDERDLFPEILRLTEQISPSAILVENVPGLFDMRFAAYRESIRAQLEALGYVARWEKLNAKDFGVPQLRPRTLLVALKRDVAGGFSWPQTSLIPPPTVGEALFDEMASRGWKGAKAWAIAADGVAPTIVGGSKKHGGPDLGPTRSRAQWARLGVDGRTLAAEPPDEDFGGTPRLTIRMAALLQGFPSDWQFAGGKTQAYRQVGNAFPPPVAKAVGIAIRRALAPRGSKRSRRTQ